MAAYHKQLDTAEVAYAAIDEVNEAFEEMTFSTMTLIVYIFGSNSLIQSFQPFI